jgi:phosphoglycerate dehydrogenase-like enzyme
VTTAALPQIWFERPVLPACAAEVAGACAVLGPGSEEDRYAGVESAIAAVVGSAPYDDAVMARAPGLRVIARTGIGYDAIDVDAATRLGIAVCNTPDGPTTSTAEHAVMLMLMAAKRVKPAEAALRSGTAATYYARHAGMELDGKTLGLVGFGRIARRVTRIAQGLGMRIVAFDPFLAAEAVPADVDRASTLEELLGSADVVSVHVPLTAASRGMFGADQFAAMRPGSVFVNTARGALVDNEALSLALESGRLIGAGIDVTAPEPLPPDHPLLARDDVVVTPHVASATVDGKARVFRAAFRQAIDVVHGRRPEHLVNPEVWERVVARTYAGVGR